MNLNAEPVSYMISYVTCVMVYGGRWKVDRGWKDKSKKSLETTDARTPDGHLQLKLKAKELFELHLDSNSK